MKDFFKAHLVLTIITGLLVADLVVWAMMLAGQRQASETALYFLDIGQGDSEFIVLPNNIQILIDGGPSSAVLSNLEKVMPLTDRSIDLVIMSHPQLDHFSGLIDVLKNYDVGAFISTGRKADVGAYKELHAVLRERQVPYVGLGEGDTINIGDATLTVLGPNPQELISGELNDTTLVLLLKTSQLSALYTGDIGENVETRLARDYDIDVDVLKVGHHGSRFSSSRAFLKEASPAISVIEVGKNTYGHPTAAALERLTEFSQKVFRTDTDGLLKIVYASSGFAVYQAR